MVKGLEDFRDFFRGRSDAYVLIGGAACDVWLSEYNITSRATKDLDLVLIVESLNTTLKNTGLIFSACSWLSTQTCESILASK